MKAEIGTLHFDPRTKLFCRPSFRRVHLCDKRNGSFFPACRDVCLFARSGDVQKGFEVLAGIRIFVRSAATHLCVSDWSRRFFRICCIYHCPFHPGANGGFGSFSDRTGRAHSGAAEAAYTQGCNYSARRGASVHAEHFQGVFGDPGRYATSGHLTCLIEHACTPRNDNRVCLRTVPYAQHEDIRRAGSLRYSTRHRQSRPKDLFKAASFWAFGQNRTFCILYCGDNNRYDFYMNTLRTENK